LEYWNKVFKEQAKQEALDRYRHLRLLGWPAAWEFLGEHPELDKIVKEILDDAVKHGIIPEPKKDLE